LEKTKEALSSYMKNKLALKRSKLPLRALIEWKEYPGMPNCIPTAFLSLRFCHIRKIESS
jgi:hypothetical protein